MFTKSALRQILATMGLGVLAATAAAQTPLGSTFTYQGRIQADGEAVIDAADFQFTLWNAASGGAQVGSAINMTLTPESGLFSANLDFGVAALNGDARWLQIAVRNPAGVGGYTTLTPRQAMNATPYSIQTRGIYVSDLENVGIGTTNPLSPLSFPSVLGEKVRLWGTAANHYGFGVQGSLLQLHTDGSGADIGFGWGSSGSFNENVRFKGNGRVGIGTTAPQNRLHVVGNGDTLALEGTDHTYMEYFPDGFAAGRKAYAGFPVGNVDNFVLNNETATGNIILRSTAGNVGINLATNATPATDLQVGGGLQVDDEIILPNGTIRRGGTSPATTDLGLYSLTSGAWMRLVSNGAPIHFFTDSTNGSASTPAVNSAAMTISSNGNVGVGTHSPATKLHVMGPIRMESGGHQLNITTGAAIDIQPSTDLYMNTPVANRIIMQTNGGSVGIGTTNPQARLDVAGVARCDTLQIDAGADLAEHYDVAAAISGDALIAPQPGMVVSIDSSQVGKLAVSAKAYDRRVAGIISGAGDVKPGLTLSQPGTVADGDYPVAAVGRVWCLVDADANGPIEAGDMLTTSETAGHAMRVSDPATASGAIIGKAMSSLDKGRGLVLVLVNLQ